jgi:hypothetical protein
MGSKPFHTLVMAVEAASIPASTTFLVFANSAEWSLCGGFSGPLVASSLSRPLQEGKGGWEELVGSGVR